jgi:hypothetical protein
VFGLLRRKRRVRGMRRSTMGREILRALAPICLALVVPAQVAGATTYVFDQTSASVPGLEVFGDMTINGGFADLPTLSNFCQSPCGPVNYGNLLAIQMSANFTGVQFTRGNLTQSPDPTAFPMWDIAPDGSLDPGIRFIDAADLGDIFDRGWENATIQTDTDSGGPCFFTGACRVTGHWVAVGVPESSSLTLLANALLGLCAIRRRAGGAPPTRPENWSE